MGLLLALLPHTQDKEERLTLDNGLRVVLKSVPHHDAVVVGVAYRAGVLDEPEGKHGLAHLVEHLAFQSATPSFAAYGAGKKLIQDGFFKQLGMDTNAETMPDFTYFYSIQPTANFELALRIEAERMRSSRFSEDVLERERPAARAEIKSVDQEPVSALYNRVLEMTYRKSNYRHPKVGYDKYVQEATLEEAREFYRAYYRPDRAVLVVYGKLPANAAELVRKHFGGIKNPEGAPPEPAEEPHEGKGVREDHTIVRVPPQILMSYKSAPPGTRGKAAVLVAVYELLRRLPADERIGPRTAQRYIYDDFRTRGRSFVMFNLILAPDADPDAVLAAVHEHVVAVAKTPPDRDAIAARIKAIRAELTASDVFQLNFLRRDRNQYFQALGQAVINRLWLEIAGPDRLPNLLAELEKVTPDDVKAAVEKYFSKDRANILIIRRN